MPTYSRSSHTPSPKGSPGRAILLILLGFVALAFWVMASLVQIQTTEIFLLAGSAASSSFIPNWTIIHQPWALATGHVTSDEAMSILGGWGIEIIFFVCTISYEITANAMKSAHAKFGRVFMYFLLAACGFDLVTDFLYGGQHFGHGLAGAVEFTAVMALMVIGFGIISMALIEHGLRMGR